MRKKKTGNGIKKLKSLLIVSILLFSVFPANLVIGTTNAETQELNPLTTHTFNGTTSEELSTFLASEEVISGDAIALSNNVIFSSAITINKELILQSVDAQNPVELLVPDTNTDRHFLVNERLTLQNIIVSGGDERTTNGGGIQLNANSTLDLRNGVVIKGNRAQNGGGIAATGENAVVYVRAGAIIENNIAYGVTSSNYISGNGGGIYAYHLGTVNVSVEGGRIASNEAASGGGIYFRGNTLSIIDGVIEGNNTSQVRSDGVQIGGHGGGIYLEGQRFFMSGGSVINNISLANGGGINVLSNIEHFAINGGEIAGNRSKDGHGGAIYFSPINYTTISLQNVSIVGNHATGNAGALSFNGGTVEIANTIISGNTAQNAGGVFFNNETIATITDTTIRENQGTLPNSAGGGIIVNANSDVTIKGDTKISENHAVYGGGIYVSGSLLALNSGFINGNIADEGAGVQLERGANFHMIGGEISENTALTYGGGVSMWLASEFEMLGGVISSNIAYEGGGIFAFPLDNHVRIVGGEIKRNNAIYGGGIFLTGAESDLELPVINLEEEASLEEDSAMSNVYVVEEKTTYLYVIEGGTISYNTATNDGGGIWTSSIDNITLTQDVEFSMNRASVARRPTENGERFEGFNSSILNNPYNNFDINQNINDGELGEVVTFQLTYKSEGEEIFRLSEITPLSILTIQSAEEVGFEREGYLFNSWLSADEEVFVGDEWLMKDDLTLLAQWRLEEDDDESGEIVDPSTPVEPETEQESRTITFILYHDVAEIHSPITIATHEVGMNENIVQPTEEEVHQVLQTIGWYNHVAHSDSGETGEDWFTNSHLLGVWTQHEAASTAETIYVSNTLEIRMHEVIFVDLVTGLIGAQEVPHGAHLAVPPIYHDDHAFVEGKEEYGGWWHGVIGNTRQAALEALFAVHGNDVVTRATFNEMTPGRTMENPTGRKIILPNTNIHNIAERPHTIAPRIVLQSFAQVEETSQEPQVMLLATHSVDTSNAQRFIFDDYEAENTPVLAPMTLALNRISLDEETAQSPTSPTSPSQPTPIMPEFEEKENNRTGSLPATAGVLNLALTKLGLLMVGTVALMYKKCK